MSDIDEYAAYLPLGLGLIPIAVGSKQPVPGYPWGRPEAVLRTREYLEAARDLFPGCGFACVNAPSHTVMLDIDHLTRARAALHAQGEDLDGWLDAGARMEGRMDERGHERVKAMFAADTATTRAVKRLAEPPPTGTLFEIRLSGYDVLPPSLHPSGTRYKWRTDPRVVGLAEWPDGLRQLVEQWPFAPVIDTGRRTRPPMDATHPKKVLIGLFNERVPVAELLAQHGYTQRRDRWRSPHAAGGSAAGVKIFADTGKIFCHHGDDPLGWPSDDGIVHGHDAFDLLVALEADGDRDRAYNFAAARLFGCSWPAWRTRFEEARRRLMEEANERLLQERIREGTR